MIGTKKRINKILSCILALCLILSVLPMSVFAAEPEVVKSYHVATLYDDGTLEVFEDLSRLASVPWQNERASIIKVVFTVDTPLYTRLFSECTNLAEITLPSTITEIPQGCFNNCTSLTSITIPDSVTSIGERAFSDCKKLSSITFGANSQLQTIGIFAFNNCDVLESIAIPDTVTSIGGSAFNQCDALANITIPDSVISIGEKAFDNCDVLTEIDYTGSVENWNSITKGAYAIPNSVKINHTGSCVDDDTNHICDLCGEAMVHSYTYTASDNVITESCICGHNETATITAPENPVYDGMAKEATVEYSDNWKGGTLTIAYGEGGNVNAESVTASIEKDGATANVVYEIAKAQIEKQTDDTTEFVYDGSEQTYAVAENDNYTISGNKMTNAGSQDVTVALKDKANFEWADGTTEDLTFTFTIAQATPIAIDGSVTKASSIRKNNKLSASTITGGKYNGIDGAELEGTYAWKEPDKDMTADSKEIVIFTPTDTNYKAVEIEVDVDVTTSSSFGGGGVSRYTVKFDTDGGTTIANKTVTRNSKLAEPEAPTKDGYSFNGWYTDEELTEKYDFDSKVTKGFTLYAKWDKHDDETPVTSEWENPFTDVKADDWYYEDVMYAVENGLFNGTTETTFAPNGIITRAMMVTVLYRAEGEPVVNKSIPFADIDMSAYYANAVIWAKQNGIVNGVSETEFAPNDNITREQIAAIMYRYAQYKGYDVSVGENTNILSYDDFADISEYAIASMQYACGSGLLKGKTNTTLNPLDNATRAEITAILHRFIEANK